MSDIIAIAKDMARCAKKERAIAFQKDVTGLKAMDNIRTRYYIKFFAIDKPGVLARIASVLAKHKISIASVSQKERKEAKVVPVVMMTHEANERDMARALKEIDALSVVKRKTVRIRIEG